MTLLLTIYAIRSQEIKLESLDSGIGLLPFKLGPLRLITHYHTFLQYVNLDDIENTLSTLQTQFRYIKLHMMNNTYSLYEYQIDYLSDKLSKVTDQLRTLEPRRSKRGLIDGLGSVIKSVTGNLDYSDAVRYNNAIKTLRNNQKKTIDEFNEHISISKEWMLTHTNIINKIVENQSKINTTLSLLIKQAESSINMIQVAKFNQLLTIVSENIEDVLSELYRIENILSFTRAMTIHHSMLGIDILGNVVDRLKEIYGNHHVIELELRQYYDIIKAGYYYDDKKIVIAFRFPIVSEDTYTLYKLSIVPNKNNQVLIPPYPFIATNGNTFMYMEAECPKLNNNRYLCEQKTNHYIQTQADCVQTFISSKTLQKSCKLTTVHLSKPAVEELDSRHYVISFPQSTRVQMKCGSDDYDTLRGSYLATIPLHCSIHTNEITLINTKDEIKGQPVKVLNIPYTTETQEISLLHANLTSINLDRLHTIQDRITLQSPISSFETTETLYHTTIPFYVILCIAAILTIAMLTRRYFPGRNLSRKPNQNDAVPTGPGNHENAVPATSETHTQRENLPATFSLSVLK